MMWRNKLHDNTSVSVFRRVLLKKINVQIMGTNSPKMRNSKTPEIACDGFSSRVFITLININLSLVPYNSKKVTPNAVVYKDILRFS